MLYANGSSQWRVGKEVRSHETGHPDTSMGRRIAWKPARVHAHSSVESQKIGHLRPAKNRPFRHRVFRYVHVRFYDVSRGIDVIAVQIGPMIPISLRDFEATGRGGEFFLAARD